MHRRRDTGNRVTHALIGFGQGSRRGIAVYRATGGASLYPWPSYPPPDNEGKWPSRNLPGAEASMGTHGEGIVADAWAGLPPGQGGHNQQTYITMGRRMAAPAKQFLFDMNLE